ncbi:glycosyltransferase [Pedobacter deserti]|uniref:glycosyltransferase n=1 Tax=Pedobacter deserti TaxID=2817382 RepID=UPI00210E6229|nr:glycosyltransferase [Pedobacter sp. SYSU D00382]
MHGGGAQRVIVHILNYLINNTRNDITLVLFNSEPSDVYLSSISRKCKILVLHSSAKFGWFKLSRLLRKEKPEILVSTLNYINIACIFATLVAASRLRLVIREARPLSKTHPFIRRIQKLLYWRVDAFWAITPIIAEELHTILKVDRNKINLAPNPIDIPDPVITSKVESQSRETVRILYVGRLIELKNVDLMLRALALIKDREWRFQIVGSGPQEAYLKGMVQNLKLVERVEFVGYSPKPYSFMQKSDIFLLASKFEGFPNVVVEALACGNLCIANNTQGGGVTYIKSLIDQLIVANFENSQEIADLVRYYIDHPKELKDSKSLSAAQAKALQIENHFERYMKGMVT